MGGVGGLPPGGPGGCGGLPPGVLGGGTPYLFAHIKQQSVVNVIHTQHKNDND